MSKSQPLLGAHMSIAGGYYKSVDAAAECQMNVVQLFTKNNNQWRAKAITEKEVEQFQESLAKHKLSHPLAHSSYLINLASPDDELWNKSIEAMAVELDRASQLGIFGVVMHPGSFTTSSEEAGLARIAAAIDQVHKLAPDSTANILLENTAGQGSNLGWKFEHLGAIIAAVKEADRLGVCIDTCHAFAAGYPLGSKEEFNATIKNLDKAVGIDRVKAFHLNDSKRELGSRVDRHEHIGQGHLGLEPFRHLLNDKRFKKVPMYLETPKEHEDEEPWDVINLRTLRSLIT